MPTKVLIVTAMVFTVVMYGCESWTIKKAEHQRTDTLELRCWRKLLGVPWTSRRSNQSILKEINPEYSSEGLMLKLKLQYLGHLMGRAKLTETNKTLWINYTLNKNFFKKDWLWGWERLRARREVGNRGWDCWMASLTQWTWVWANSGR